MFTNRDNDYINGHIERLAGGEYGGEITVEGINLSPVIAQYFKDGDDNYLWIRRKPLLEYNPQTMKYQKRQREPYFEAYLKKQKNEDAFAYVGEFTFMRFKFKIVGIWDSILRDNKRLNLFVERLPMSQQTIINNINKRKHEK